MRIINRYKFGKKRKHKNVKNLENFLFEILRHHHRTDLEPQIIGLPSLSKGNGQIEDFQSQLFKCFSVYRAR